MANKKTITLTEPELINLITESTLELQTEQARLESKISPYWKDKLYKAGMTSLFGPGLGTVTSQLIDYDEWPEGSYHWAVDGVSVIAYIVCPYTEGIGCAVSVAADVLNASLYVHYDDPPDYYMAGMQMAFSVVPAGEALKYEAKFLKPYITPLFKKGWDLGLRASKQSLESVVYATLKSMPADIIYKTKQLFPKWSVKGMREIYEAAQKGMNLKGYAKLVTSLFPTGIGTIQKITEKLWMFMGGLLRAFILFLEAIWYDPEMLGGILKIGGEWTGIEALSSWGEAMELWPKYGLKLANKYYKNSGIGGIRALVTTSIADCNNTVYDWDDTINQWMIDNNLTDFNENRFEEDWWGGWRPTANVRIGGEDDVNNSELMETQAMFMQYAAMKNCKKMIKNKEYGPYLNSCSRFASMYKSQTSEERFHMLLNYLKYDEEEEC